MAKDKLTDYDSTAGGNLDVGGISVAEGMLPSGVNNAMRELMSHQADAFGAGTPLYVDQTNNRLGIGNAAPATALDVDANGATVATFDRATSDGSIVDFQKSGTTVGSIASTTRGGATDIFIGSGDTGIYFTQALDAVAPSNQGSDRDAAIDLGRSANRFKDLYLSGGAYLGGTGSANLLDDYEEGTWTPAVSSASSHIVQTGIYTKIGNLVTIQCVIQFVQSGTVFGSVSGLPFTVAEVNYSGITFREWYSTGITLSGNLTIGAQSTTGFWNYANSSTATNGQTYGYGFSISYRT